MKRNNRRMRYRRRGYGRRQSHLLWILPLATALTLLIAFLVFGTLLNRRNRAETPPTDTGTESAVPSDTTRTPVREVRAYPVALETADTTTFADRLAANAAAGRLEASVALNTREGLLLYRSELASQLGFSTYGTPTVTLESALTAAKDTGVYISGVYYLTVFSEENDLLRSVALSRTAALLAEGLRAGLHDVLLVVPELTEPQTEELLRFVEELHALAPDSVVGLALSAGQYAAENGARIAVLYDAADYLALEAVSHTDPDPVGALSATVTDPNIRYHLLQYQVRILIPNASDDTGLAARIAVPEAEKFQNWQILP